MIFVWLLCLLVRPDSVLNTKISIVFPVTYVFTSDKKKKKKTTSCLSSYVTMHLDLAFCSSTDPFVWCYWTFKCFNRIITSENQVAVTVQISSFENLYSFHFDIFCRMPLSFAAWYYLWFLTGINLIPYFQCQLWFFQLVFPSSSSENWGNFLLFKGCSKMCLLWS